MTALLMFNLSAAFDLIDHPILVKRLEFSDKTSPDVGFHFGVQ